MGKLWHGWWLLAAPALLAARPARAGGGSDVVDDAAVEAPGTCYVETWVTRYRADAKLANVGPACAPAFLPGVEIGATFQHLLGGRDQTTAGPVAKWRLRPAGRGWNTAIDLGVDWDPGSGKLEDATVLMPVTLVVTRRIAVSANAGYSYVRTARDRHALFWGGQVEAQLTPDLGLMAEGFGRTGDKAGLQTRLRWTPRNGSLDLDLAVGHYVDGVSPSAITLGLTLRR